MVKSVENEGNIVELAWSMDDQQLNKIKSDYSSFTKTTVLLTLSSSLSEEIALKPFNT